MAKKTLDLRGEICPVPMIMTSKEFDALEPGGSLMVMIDSIQTVRNILRWCEQKEIEAEVNDDGDLWSLTLKK